MIYLGKGKNKYKHVKGVNVYYMSNDKSKLIDHGCKVIDEFKNSNLLFSSIHKSRLKVIEL